MTRRNGKLVLAAVGGLASFLCGAPEASASCTAQSYPFYCRGKMLMTVGDNPANRLGSILTIAFTKNATASGPVGNRLAYGSCAWLDRPVNATEPSNLVIGIDNSYTPSSLSAGIVTQCTADHDCVFYGCAHNVGNALEMYNNPITRIFLTN